MGFMTLCGVGQPPVASGTFAAWNPSDKHADITLSGSNLIATRTVNTGPDIVIVRSVTSHNSGKFYAECQATAYSNAVHVEPFGMAQSTEVLNDFLGNTSLSYGYLADGETAFNGTFTANAGNALAVGEWARLALDMGAGNLWFGDSTGWVGGGDPAAGTTPTYSSVAAATWFLACGPGDVNDKMTLNTGGSAFNYTIPSGFTAWG